MLYFHVDKVPHLLHVRHFHVDILIRHLLHVRQHRELRLIKLINISISNVKSATWLIIYRLNILINYTKGYTPTFEWNSKSKRSLSV
jgi:hypothetical protein